MFKKLGENERVLGCFPLYPPLELLDSMNFTPFIMWGFKNLFSNTHQSDKHIQNYVCSIVRYLTEFSISEYGSILKGLLFYNACDSLRNLPEILTTALRGKNQTIPSIHFHLPMKSMEKSYVHNFLINEINLLIQDLEKLFQTTFNFEQFRKSVNNYRKYRQLSKQLEDAVIQNKKSYEDYVKTMFQSNYLNIHEKIKLVNSSLKKISEKSTLEKNSNMNKVILSGIFPPPLKVIKLIENSGFQIVGNDIASLRRSVHYTPPENSYQNVGEYYVEFYQNHFPCPTLLYTSDRRIPKFLELIDFTDADGVIFIGEKFCEYEYFEFPTLKNALNKNGIKTLELEFSAEETYNIEAYKTRIEAFYELISNI
ncbi:MAG: R-phenyllactate dehydratase beta subunit [Promethearchaeota archaeon]|nr:MAG: R-phenyllactate dehydratase beta subunit [Candidatus Lokiarchaeota archaeon]